VSQQQQQQQQISQQQAIDAFQARYPGLKDDLGGSDYLRIYKTIISWDSWMWEQGIRFDSIANVDLVLGFLRNQLAGVVSEKNLNIAACSTWAGLKFEPGYEMADPQAEKKAQAAAEKERAEKEEAERKRQQNPVFRDQRRVLRESREAQETEEAARVEDATNNVNSEAFKKTQKEAKEKFDNLCDTYTLVRPSGKTDHTTTQERRAGLKAIKAVHRQKDKAGNGVLVYTEMLKVAKELLNGFEREDSKVRY
jgi:hypothetical protein